MAAAAAKRKADEAMRQLMSTGEPQQPQGDQQRGNTDQRGVGLGEEEPPTKVARGVQSDDPLVAAANDGGGGGSGTAFFPREPKLKIGRIERPDGKH